MSDSYINGKITLQPTSKVTRKFYFPAASSESTRGAIPYNTTVSSVVVTAYDADGVNVSTQLISGTPSVDSNIVTVVLTYPATKGDGKYKLSFALSLSNGDIENFDFPGIIARDF
jgi:hypothetical protein